MKLIYLSLILAYVIGCKPAETNFNETIEILDDFSLLQERIDAEKDKTIVVNFWATTCGPCIKEMPHFRELENQYKATDLKVLLVSLDLPRDHEKRVLPFIVKHDIQPEVLHLTDENYSKWTDQIDSSWYGALPATKIINGDQSTFKFGMYESLEEIKQDIESVK
ncbi:TlpA family protein disulfide reductase [Portibacter lacus]|uniref:Thioredoxin domain-containing protein n=1 Tax=Portibacter lacus TaxID=1099794 RepID=A0AA37SRZ9_9BACT|nr:TlpA disulfide reductase family protein [Portibacter lacus]GLR18685.1 hypothetical protein GCM10007940_33010 [Portibacter lacus]